MTRRSRHGLHVVSDSDAQIRGSTPVPPNRRGRPFLSLQQQSLALAIAGSLNSDTAGRLRMYLSMFTAAGGPRELVLDLSDVVAVDEEGMAPVFEADEAMCLRGGSLRLASVSAAISHYLDDVRCDRTLTTGLPPDTQGGRGLPRPEDD